ALRRDDLEMAGRVALLDFDLDDARIEPALAQLLAQLLAGALEGFERRGAIRRLVDLLRARQQQVEHALFGILLGLVGDFADLLFANQIDADLDKVANHRFDIAPDVADFGKLRGFDFEKGRVREARQTAGNLGFADAGRADHDDIFGNDILRHIGGQLLPADAVAQGDGDGALGGVLADDILVQLGNNLPRRHLI